MALWKRFGNNKADKELFHSSGMLTNPDSASLGSGSSETFEQRRQVERNRQVIGGYHEAGLIHTYKREAHRHRTGQRNGGNHGGTTAQPTHERRIDIINPRRSSDKAGATQVPTANSTKKRPPISDIRRPLRGAQPVVKPSFHEPGGRRYNPYQ